MLKSLINDVFMGEFSVDEGSMFRCPNVPSRTRLDIVNLGTFVINLD